MVLPYHQLPVVVPQYVCAYCMRLKRAQDMRIFAQKCRYVETWNLFVFFSLASTFRSLQVRVCAYTVLVLHFTIITYIDTGNTQRNCCNFCIIENFAKTIDVHITLFKLIVDQWQ